MPRPTQTRCVRTDYVFGDCMVCWTPIIGKAHLLDRDTEPLWLRCEAHCVCQTVIATKPEYEPVLANA